MEAAPSPTSLLPPPPAPQLGRGAPGLGRGVAIHAPLVEASAAREGVGDPGCKSWRSEAGRAATPAAAPVRCSPMGSERVPLSEVMVTRTRLLEDELRSLKEELALCQADKEFVWSLWKRLQVTNPDVTQAVSLVVERENQKSEAKDRKVLEILQVKDTRIQELEQSESGLKQDIKDLLKRKIAMDEENALLRNELIDLQKKFIDKSQEVKDTKECVQNKEEHNRLVIKNLEKENETLKTRCTDLLNELEKLRKQEAYWRNEKCSIDTRIKTFEDNLIEARKEIEVSQSKYDALILQLNSKQNELNQKDMDITLVRKELQELQNLYRQNSAHTAQQAELIKQLQILNMDTQKVLKNQEDVHTAESISHQKLYNELHICFETTKSNEAILQQRVVSLQDQLVQKEQENNKLKERLQKSQGAPPFLPENDSDHSELIQVSERPSISSLEALMVSQKSEIKYLQEKLNIANGKLSENISTNNNNSEKNTLSRSEKKHKEPPVKRSRSLSPKSSSSDSEELRKLRKAERKMENLEKAVLLKSQENDELRDAHEKCKERLQMLQTNYRAVKEQLKQWEEGCGMMEINKLKKADPQQLQSQDSDTVWNELCYFKRENQDLIFQKLNLQEELDTLKVRMRADKATIQELKTQIEEKDEQLFRKCEDDGVKKSPPEKNVKEMSEQTLQKIIELEDRLKSFEKGSRKLKEGNKKLMKENYMQKSLLKQQQEDLETKGKDLESLQRRSKDTEKHKTELQVKISELEREVTSLRTQVAETNGLRNENEDLMNSVEKLQHSADKAVTEMATTSEAQSRQYDCKTTITKINFKAAKKKCSLGRYHTVLNHCVKVKSNVFENLSKDGWEDVSESSDNETQTSQNLGTIIVETSEKINPIEDGMDQKESEQAEDNHTQGKEIVQVNSNADGKNSKDFHYKNAKRSTFLKKNNISQKGSYTTIPTRANKEKWKNIPSQKSNSNNFLLRERIITLQQQNSLLQNAKKTAELSVKEYKEVNEKLLQQQQASDQRIQTSKQTIKRLNLNLTELRKEKEDLLKKLESSSEITSLAEVSRLPDPRIQVSTFSAKSMDLEIKQLQCKLKNATNEFTKQSSNMKSLKFELLAKEEHIKEVHEKMSRMERDITMKRQLIEDLKFRQKMHLESNESTNEMLDSLEKKVKTLTEECFNKKVSIDSLKQRLSVAVKEKAQYEQMYQKTKEELEKKDLKLNFLVAKVNETESTVAELEAAASKHLKELALQSEQVLEGTQKKLLLANDKVEEFTIFVKALVKELQNDVHEIRQKIKGLKKMQRNKGACKISTHKAQTLAASILNISRSDLEEILDTEDEVEMEKSKVDAENDKEWLLYIQKLLEGQLPFASYLLEAVLEKINEKKNLVERYYTIMRDAR